MWKDFFYFTRWEKKGIILLALLIVLVMIIRFVPDAFRSTEAQDNTDNPEKVYAEFLTGIRENAPERTRNLEEPFKSHITTPHLIVFDPNSADSITFIGLGMPGWMARNIVSYRTKGGKFRKPEDLRKIYGMTDELYESLAPYISIAEQPVQNPESPGILTTITEDTVRQFPKTIKYPAGTVINLNEADTTELKMIPGIGSAIAKRISAYRTKLGGFYTVAQLNEIELDTTQFAPWFSADGEAISRINLNKVSVDRLRNHPYFNFYQAKAIVELRKKKGALTGLDELILLEEFTGKDFERMKHYVCFE